MALPIIVEFEGFRSAPYKDPAGIWTYGFGFTTDATGSKVNEETPPIAKEYALVSLGSAVREVGDGVRAGMKRQPTDHQLAALTSLTYNIGLDAFLKSTLLSEFNAGRMNFAAKCILDWDHVGSTELNGLLNRRLAELMLFMTPDGPDA